MWTNPETAKYAHTASRKMEIAPLAKSALMNFAGFSAGEV